MKRSLAFVVAVSAILSSGSVFADDLQPPSWRGGDLSTVQAWTFPNDAAFIIPPDEFRNPYGRPGGGVTNGRRGTSEWRDLYQEHDGVWQLTGTATITFRIPNADREHFHKDVWVQITYHAFFGPPRIDVADMHPDGEVVTDLGDGWAHRVIRFHGHCGRSERVEVRPPEEGSTKAYVDQVVIDTQCFRPGSFRPRPGRDLPPGHDH